MTSETERASWVRLSLGDLQTGLWWGEKQPHVPFQVVLLVLASGGQQVVLWAQMCRPLSIVILRVWSALWGGSFNCCQLVTLFLSSSGEGHY